MPYITDFEVTYGAALAPAGFHRVTRPDDHPADLVAHAGGGAQAYLWSREGGSRALPIIEVDVVFGDEAVPEGFEKVTRNLIKGSGRSAYLCYRRRTEKDDGIPPLADVVIVYGDEEPGEGFERLEKAVYSGGDEHKPVYLAFKRASEADGDSDAWNADNIKVKDRVDVKDVLGRWMVGEVVGCDEETLTLSLENRFYKSEEQLPRHSPRIAELGRHTSAREEGYQTQEGVTWAMPAEEVEAFLQKMEDLCAMPDSVKLMDDEARASFLSSDFPAILHHCLLVKDASASLADHIGCVLQSAMPLLVRVMLEAGPDPLPPSLSQLLPRLFNLTQGRVWFYDCHGHGLEFRDRLDRYHTYVKERRGDLNHESVYVLRVLHDFMEHGGCEAVIERFRKAPLQELGTNTKLLIRLANLLPDGVKDDFVPAWRDEMGERLATVTHEELASVKQGPAQNQDLLESLTREWARLVSEHWNEVPERDMTNKLVEQVFLRQCQRLIGCPYLNFRIRGISLLNDIIENSRTTARAAASWSFDRKSRNSDDRSIQFYRPPLLAEWLVDEKVVELVMGVPEELKHYKLEETHFELIRRAEAMLSLLADERQLRIEHIRALWGASLKQADSSQVRCVFQHLGNLANRMDGDMMVEVLKGLEAMPKPFEDYHMDLVGQVARAAQRYRDSVGEEVQKLSLDFLIDTLVASQHAGLSPHLHKAGMEPAIDLIRDDPYTRQARIKEYVGLCVDAIKEGLRTVDALELLASLIDLVPAQRTRAGVGEMSHRAGYIDVLEEQYEIACLIISDLERYKAQSRARAAERGAEGGGAASAMNTTMNLSTGSLMEACLVSETRSHRTEIETRLQFLQNFLLSSTDLQLSYDQARQLWRLLYCQPLCPEEAECFLLWLSKLLKDEPQSSSRSSYYSPPAAPEREILDDDTVKQVFSNLLANPLGPEAQGMDVTSLGLEGFHCFKRYFVQVNLDMNLLVQDSRGRPQVDKIALIGFETLWDMCLHTRNADVLDKATSLFIGLHMQITRTADRRAIWGGLIRRCMDRLHDEASAFLASPASPLASRDRAMAQVLVVLKRFLDQTNDQVLPSPLDAHIGIQPDGIHAKICVRDERRGSGGSSRSKSDVYYTFAKTTVTLGHLKARVARDMHCRGDCVRLRGADNVAYNHDDMYLDSIGSQQTYHVTLLAQPDDETAHFDQRHFEPAPYLKSEVQSEPWQPRMMLCETSGYFDQLFQLLSMPAVASKAWELISMLPISSSISRRLDTLDTALPSSPPSSPLSSLPPPPPRRPAFTLSPPLLDKSPSRRSPSPLTEATGVTTSCASSASSIESRKEEASGREGAEIDWEALLDGRSPLRLLYKLGYVDREFVHKALVLPPPTQNRVAGYDYAYERETEERDRAIRWCYAFVTHGGLDYLLSILSDWDTTQACASSLSKGALSSLLSFIACFLPPRSMRQQAAEEADDATADEKPTAAATFRRASRVLAERDWKELTTKLLEVLKELTRSAFEAPGLEGQSGAAPPSESSDDDSDTTSSSMSQSGSGSGGSVVPMVLGDGPAHERRQAVTGARLSVLGSASFADQYQRAMHSDFTTGIFIDTLNTNNHGEETNTTSDRKEDLGVVLSAMKLLNTLTRVDGFYDHLCHVLRPDLCDVVRCGLIGSSGEHMRVAVARGLHKLCVMATTIIHPPSGVVKDPVRSLLSLLISLLHSVPDAELGKPSPACPEYFTLVLKLMSATGARQGLLRPVDEEQEGADRLAMARTLAVELRHRRFGEASEDEMDPNLHGLLRTLLCLLDGLGPRDAGRIRGLLGSPPSAHPLPEGEDGEGLIHELVHNCLFAVSSSSTGMSPLPKCKHEASVQLGLLLLVELCKHCPANLAQVLEAISPHHRLGMSMDDRVRRRSRALRRESKQGAAARRASAGSMISTSSFHSINLSSSRNRTGYAGLKNLGCICYMNSTLQQFFMIKGFREGILSFVDPDAEQTGDRDENLMFQLQTLFAHLQETHKGYYNPKGFCNALKNWEGEPTDVFMQQDVSEFFNLFFQQVEGLTQGTRWENVLRDSFGGMMSNELLADGGKYSERSDPFYYLIVPVRNMVKLDAALEAYIAGESVEYAWESEDKDTGTVTKEVLPTIKRQSIKTLPRHLMICLKRFDFDYEVMQQVKINERLEFPHELDMFRYTLEGRKDAIKANGDPTPDSLPPSPGEGDGNGSLSGNGASRSRDYYRYRLAGVVVHMGTAHSGHYYSYIKERGGRRRWFEFNDTIVTEFDPKDLEAECFGGEEITHGYRYANISREKTRNAFMLVYDRLDVDQQNKRRGDSLRPTVPEPIMAEIRRENLEYWRKVTILNERYFEFMKALLHEDEDEDEDAETPRETNADMVLHKIKVATRFTLGTLAEARSEERMRQWAEGLLTWYEACPQAREWLLAIFAAQEENLLRDVIMEGESVACRHIAADLLGSVALLSRAEHPLLISSLLRQLLELRAAKWRNGGQRPGATNPNEALECPAFTHLLAMLTTCNPHAARDLMLGEEPQEDADDSVRSVLMALLLFLTLPPDAVSVAAAASSSESYTSSPPDYMTVLFHLLCGCAIPYHPEHADPSPSAAPRVYSLSDDEQSLLKDDRVWMGLVRMVKDRDAEMELTRLFAHLLWENRKLSDKFMDAWCHVYKDTDGLGVLPLFRPLAIAIGIGDSLREDRLEMVMQRATARVKGDGVYIRATECGLQMLLRLARREVRVRAWMAEPAPDTDGEDSGEEWEGRASNILRPRDQLDWVLDWLRRDLRNELTQCSTHKSGRGLRPHYSQPNSWNPGHTPVEACKLEQLLFNFHSLLTGTEPYDDYDSDDEPEALVGRMINLWWSHDRAFKGEVVGYDQGNKRHRIMYPDGRWQQCDLATADWILLPQRDESEGEEEEEGEEAQL